ncbi:MAG: succinate-semialdehyde dehydrogenase [Alphaproteobacteria bacterium]|nr:succinate-semialdehyde dehydrogenase [Alphaproteobacteria bacterium]
MSAALDLQDKDLLRTEAFIGGAWVAADKGKSFAVLSPANGSELVGVADCGVAETRRAIEAADGAGPAWAALTGKERGQVLRRWFDLITQHQEDLARIMTAEQGKPLAEARGEIAYGAGFVEWAAEEAKRVYGDVVPPFRKGARTLVLKQPLGVVAAITPWNFPSAMITRKCAPALATGCTLVIKPAEQTPLSALALAVLAERAGLPPGALNIVTAHDPAPVGAELTGNPRVRKVSFTGSTEVGKLLMRQAADGVKKMSLELGGNAPFIVFDDADLPRAVEGVLASKFRNAGQTCVCANRIYVQAGIYDAFAAALGKAMQALKTGPGDVPDVHIGPLIDDAAIRKVETLVEDAKKQGGKVTAGGARHALGGLFYEPTLIEGAHGAMRLAHEEIFGPVAALFRFGDEAEVIALANDTEYGLAAYFYTRDLGRAFRVAEALEAGIVAVNEGVFSTETAPFGGVKQSGFGREGSHYGTDEFVNVKYVLMGGIDGEPA